MLSVEVGGEAVDLPLQRKVGDQHVDCFISGRRAQVAGGFSPFRLVSADEDNGGPQSGQSQCGGLANPGCGTGHQANLAMHCGSDHPREIAMRG